MGDGRIVLAYADLEPRWAPVTAAIAEGSPPGPVAVLMANDATGIVAALAAMDSGRPVAIIDPQLPPERLREIIEFSGAGTALYGPAAIDHLPLIKELFDRSIALDDDGGHAVEKHATAAPGPGGPPRGDPVGLGSEAGPALVMFTSGSTGRPKGVVCGHHVFAHDAWAKRRALGIGDGDRVLALPALAFMLGAASAWGALLGRASLALYDPRVQGLGGLLATLADVRPTVLVGSPVALRAMADLLVRAGERGGDDADLAAEGLSDLRMIDCGGERVPWATVAALAAHVPGSCRFSNGVGSTETALRSLYVCRMDEPMPAEGYVPAGHPVEGKDVRLVSDDGTPVAADEVGEIAIVSEYLASGYWREPALTAEKFGARRRRDDLVPHR